MRSRMDRNTIYYDISGSTQSPNPVALTNQTTTAFASNFGGSILTPPIKGAYIGEWGLVLTATNAYNDTGTITVYPVLTTTTTAIAPSISVDPNAASTVYYRAYNGSPTLSQRVSQANVCKAIDLSWSSNAAGSVTGSVTFRGWFRWML